MTPELVINIIAWIIVVINVAAIIGIVRALILGTNTRSINIFYLFQSLMLPNPHVSPIDEDIPLPDDIPPISDTGSVSLTVIRQYADDEIASQIENLWLPFAPHLTQFSTEKNLDK